ncbi:Glycoside hydrolase, family 28 [Corchorus capsularis]|uniref:Glycoside hydrolase, family 28 n=1 Tax=Corchorus capsularis TaxID=210143 RepID=A0A1R3HDU4_COCAP|nr:Glycoside hydrolase, family 28 [Corchorus capsularis]
MAKAPLLGATANALGPNFVPYTLLYNLRFDYLNNSVIQDITSKDSKQFHVNVLGCRNITFQRFTVSAPELSTNTDGIHIGRSDLVRILDSRIETGDDCVSLGDGSKNVYIERVMCGPGHGISVGSLGFFQGEEDVIGVFVRNCTLTNTPNGVRIKTWPASHPGRALDMHFEDIIMNNVSFPIIIDQEYCPWNQCNLKAPSNVQLNTISFKNIRGTSASREVVRLVCSKGFPCQGVELADINLIYQGLDGPGISDCANVAPILSGTLNPIPCTATFTRIA